MNEDNSSFRVEQFYTREGRSPFADWTRRMKNLQGRIAIDRRVNRIMGGNFGDHKFCREGVWELRIGLGPGYRVYYALAESTVVLLLCGGDKSTQTSDIDRACSFWQEFQQRS